MSSAVNPRILAKSNKLADLQKLEKFHKIRAMPKYECEAVYSKREEDWCTEDDLKSGVYVFELLDQSKLMRFFADFDVKEIKSELEFKVLRSFANQAFQELRRDENGWVFTDGSYDDGQKRKLSFHLINKNILFEKKAFTFKSKYGKYMLNTMLKHLLDEYTLPNGEVIYPRDIFESSLDDGVYGGKHCFRLPYATTENKPYPHIPMIKDSIIDDYFVTPTTGVMHPLMKELSAEMRKKEREAEEKKEMKLMMSPDQKVDEEPLTEERQKKMVEMLQHVKLERFKNYKDWFELMCLMKGNRLPEEMFFTMSKNSGYKEFDSAKCLDQWGKLEEKRTFGFPLIHKWLEEDGVDWKSMFCKKKRGMVDDLLKAWREFSTLTDMSIAEIFFKHYSDSLYFTEGQWLHYTEGRGWEMGNCDSVVYPLMKLIGGSLNAYVTSMKAKEDEDEKKFEKKKAALMKECVALCSYSKCSKVIKACQGLFKNNTILSEFDQHPDWFCFSDFKAIDMHTGSVIEIQKEHKILTTCGYPLPERDEKEIERAKEFVLSIMEEKVYDSYMSMLACSFHGDPNLNQKIFIHTGSGGNGKSLMTILLQAALGAYAEVLPIEQLTKDSRGRDEANSALAGMRGKRYAQFVEPEDEKETTLKVGRVKELTGESKIKVRGLFKEATDLQITFTMNLFCNEQPKVSKFDGGLERRLVVFPYEFRFVDEPDETDPYQKKKNPHLGDIIKRDKKFQAGFLYLCLDHWKKNKGLFISSDVVKEANKTYMRDNNKVVAWLDQHYKPSDSWVRMKQVHADYTETPGTEKLTSTSFTAFVSSLGHRVVVDKSNGNKVYLKKIIRCDECKEDVDVCGGCEKKKLVK